jgi:Raf kinase inhibitor-like YbhB/YbcL family protein
MSLRLTSRGFQNEGTIPEKHSKDGGNVSPPLAWRDVPEGTKTFALIVDDPDAPSGVFVHWLLYGIPANTTELNENMPASGTLPGGARQGRNGFGDLGYGGPQPPSGTHRYFFHLYALDYEPPLSAGASREEVDEAIQGHTIEEAQLMGRYSHRAPGTRVA